MLAESGALGSSGLSPAGLRDRTGEVWGGGGLHEQKDRWEVQQLIWSFDLGTKRLASSAVKDDYEPCYESVYH